MESKVDVARALKAVSRIQANGKPNHKQLLQYRGIELETDYDGYTVILRNADVSLTIFFHNKHELKFKNRPALDDFYETLKKIAAER